MVENYFAYGSNLSFKRMVSRCPSAKFVSTGILKGYEFCFPLFAADIGGGVAGLRISDNEQVEGVIYEISSSDLLRLDRFEHVHLAEYSRVKMPIIKVPEQQFINTWVYVSNNETKENFKPTIGYLDHIIKGSYEFSLSKSYQDYIREVAK